jgi:hypothetical protein
MCLCGPAWPHSHAGSGVGEPADHASRPHVHLGGHHADHATLAHGHTHADATTHEHDHDPVSRDETPGPSFAPTADHDADAYYLSSSVPSVGRKASQDQTTRARAIPWQGALGALMPNGASLHRVGFGVAPPGLAADLPILLRTMSLRV